MLKIQFHKCRNISHPFPIFAWAIMIFQGMLPWKKSSWSHMSLSQENNVFDARFTGTQRSQMNNFLETYKLLETIELEFDITLVEVEEWFKKHEGKKYDYLQLFGLLSKYFGFVKVNKVGKNLDSLICSELLIDFLIEFKGLEVDDTDDYDLLNTWEILSDYQNQ